MARRTKIWAVLATLTLTSVICGVLELMHGCAQPPRLTGRLLPSEQRSQKLMALAAEDAAQISDVDARLTRLLNLADAQVQRKWAADARTTLGMARQTLSSQDAANLNDHARLSGWVSISELSRLAGDDDGGIAACDGAVAAMRAIDNPDTRCDYVMGVCNQIQYLKGKPAAAQVLCEAGPWTKAIDDVPRRRQAVVSFAAALFNLDDFTNGQKMLRNEPDASWRSDTLTQLAMLTSSDTDQKRSEPRTAMSYPQAGGRRGGAQQVQQAQIEQVDVANPYFGKQLNYNQVFRGQRNSQTSK
jgi:hypothetical protein